MFSRLHFILNPGNLIGKSAACSEPVSLGRVVIMNLGDMGKINAAYPSVVHCNQVSKNGVQGLSV